MGTHVHYFQKKWVIWGFAFLAMTFDSGCTFMGYDFTVSKPLEQSFNSFSGVEVKKFTAVEDITPRTDVLNQTIDYITDNLPKQIDEKQLFTSRDGEKIIIDGRITKFDAPDSALGVFFRTVITVEIDVTFTSSSGKLIATGKVNARKDQGLPDLALPMVQQYLVDGIVEFIEENYEKTTSNVGP